MRRAELRLALALSLLCGLTTHGGSSLTGGASGPSDPAPHGNSRTSLGQAASVTKAISVDLSAAAPPKQMRFVYGVDRGPQCQGIPPFTPEGGAHPQDTGADTSEYLHSMGATVIRTHGSGELDWEKLFPHPLLDVRTDDPANYRFAAGDAVRKMMNFVFKTTIFALKTRNCMLKTRKFVLQTRNFVLKIMKFAVAPPGR